MALPGVKVVAHTSPDKRGSWDLNGELGWYVGPAQEHYRCVTIYFPKKHMMRACDTVEFYPHHMTYPTVSTRDFLRQTATDMVDILLKPPSPTIPSLAAGDPVRNAVCQIAEQLQQIRPIPADTHIPQKTATHHDNPHSPRVSKSQHNLAPSPRVHKETSHSPFPTPKRMPAQQ